MHKRRKIFRTSCLPPHNPPCQISTMSDRLNLSAGQRLAFMGAVTSEGGVNFQEATLSVKITWSAGKKVRENIANNIKTNFIAPKHSVLHWDGKLDRHK